MTTQVQEANTGSGSHLNPPTDEVILEVRGLKKYFPVSRGWSLFGERSMLKAIDGVDFDVRSGETFGLVGESGCGKTTTAKTILGLEPATDGNVLYSGIDIADMKKR